MSKETHSMQMQTDQSSDFLRFILTRDRVILEKRRIEENVKEDTVLSRLSLPLALWPQFHKAVCYLGAFMNPLPAPAYQARVG